MTQLSTFRRIAPEFAAIADGAVEEWLADAATSMATSARWGAVYDQAVANLAAHLMTLDGVGQALTPGDPGAGAGLVATSVKTGNLSVTYTALAGSASAGSSGAGGDYATTKYGRRYWQLLNSRAARLPRVY